MTNVHKFTMKLSLNVLNHLGIGLYSNVPAVLSELVANAWDADARTVKIHIDQDRKVIEVEDTGNGMTVPEINSRFLTVGYRRREGGATTASGRKVMGRKGIGKLSSFSIAEIVEVHTVRNGQANALLMDRSRIKDLMEDHDTAKEYHPQEIQPITNGLEKGTRLVLRKLDKRLSWTGPHLRRRLARRFSVIGPSHGFEVEIDGVPITIEDREFKNKLEFLWYFGDDGRAMNDAAGSLRGKYELDAKDATVEIVRDVEIVREPDGEVEIRQETERRQVRGWIGTVDRPEVLDEANNAVVLLSRGKLVHEDILPEFKEAGIYADYVIGEINADFLDDDDQDDIVTSGRQSVKEDDARYKAVSAFVQQTLKRIKNEWTTLRLQKGKDRALAYPTVRRWYERLGPDHKKTAERLFGKVESLTLPDLETKKELYRSTMLAFEKLALKDMLSALENLETLRDFETLARLIAGVDELEATNYYEVVKGRLSVIARFREIVPGELEKVIQRYIFDHLWLLHPSWERAASNRRIEETVTTEFGSIDSKLTEEEKSGRIDIRYKTAAGKHIIIELKKADRSVQIHDLLKQLSKYRDALKKCLETRFPEEPAHIEVIAILGSPPTPHGNERENRRLLWEMGARYITYEQLILEAERSYSEYLEREREVSELIEIVEGLDVDFAPETASAGSSG